MDNTPDLLRPPCPFCIKADGRVCAVKFDGDIRTLTFRCHACNRSWVAEEYSGSVESHWALHDYRSHP